MDFMRQNWAWMLSFGGFMVAVLSYVFVQIMALKKGVQALLRSQITSEYYKYKEQKKVPLYVKDNVENLWIQYEKLGKNGVIDRLHVEFMGWETAMDTGVIH